MKIELDLNKTLAQNADELFQKSKKAKRKIEGLQKALSDSEKKLSSFNEKSVQVEKQQKEKLLKKRKKQWFEKFHWIFSSQNRLILAGRDAGSNEELVKNYMKPGDLYFHPEYQGSPHCIIKTEKNFATTEEKIEAAIFVASFSKAWEAKISSLDVYSVLPEQVSKKAPQGESMGKGAFMIYGKREWFKKTPIHLAIGIQKSGEELIVISGAESCVKKHANFYVRIIQGSVEKNETAKQLKKLFEKKLNVVGIDLDEVLSMLPSGGIKIVE
ncbi:MAG: NFACT RNA binding domain-containing protein [archaeon]|nr:NFACT RNA binding domain-containing protein [archaeon]